MTLLDGLPKTDLSAQDIGALSAIASALPEGAVCAEIGSYLGASALVIARKLPRNGRLHCIDTWMNDAMSEGSRDTYTEFLKNTEREKSRIVPLRMESTTAARDFSADLDFLFIDADHSYDSCKADILAWLPRVRPGGVVAFHDVGWAEGVQRAIREHFLPAQEGEGELLPNLYWARVGGARQASVSKKLLTAHAAVISRQAVPSSDQLARLAPGLGDMPWSWIAAGSDRQTKRVASASEGHEPALRDAGAVGLLAGRQKALEISADAEIVIFLDDDVTLPAGWAKKILEPFSDPDIHFVGCRYLPDYEHTPPDWMEGLWGTTEDGFRILGHLSLLDGGDVSRAYSPSFAWGLCLAARRDTVVKLGGFNPDGYPWGLRRFRGDGETGLSAKAKVFGFRAYYQADTHVLHAVPAERMTPQYLARRSYLQGISDSYTAIRFKGEAPAERKTRPTDLARRAKWWAEEFFLLRRPTGAGVQKLMIRNQRRGRMYHEAEVRNDPRLLEWVLRANYGNGSLPEGWRTYLDR